MVFINKSGFFLAVGISVSPFQDNAGTLFGEVFRGTVVDLWEQMALVLAGGFTPLQESVNTTEKLHKATTEALVPKMCIFISPGSDSFTN